MVRALVIRGSACRQACRISKTNTKEASVRARHWPVFLFSLSMVVLWTSHASADEWFSRQGDCLDWRGRWMIDRDQSGVWVGNIDFLRVGGPCSPPGRSRASYEVRAAIVGDDFFASRRSGDELCMLHGKVQGDEVHGRELCRGNNPWEFTLQLHGREPDERGPERREEWREPEPPRH
jgi:hypothetical protein